MPLLCPRSPNYISGPGKAVAAVPEHLAEPPGGLSPLVLSARLRFHLPAAVEQSCKPEPPYCAVPSKNRMGGGLGFLVLPCAHFMELIYEPCSLDHTSPNCNSLASRSSCYCCFTVLHEQPQKPSLWGGKEQCLGTESVSWGGEAQPQKKPLFDPVNGRALEAGDH